MRTVITIRKSETIWGPLLLYIDNLLNDIFDIAIVKILDEELVIFYLIFQVKWALPLWRCVNKFVFSWI